MTQILTTGDGALALLLGGGLWLAAGGLIGAFHFLTLRRSAQMLTTGAALPLLLPLHLIRFAITAGALTMIARHGALPLIAATLGILASRAAVLRADFVRSGSPGRSPPPGGGRSAAKRPGGGDNAFTPAAPPSSAEAPRGPARAGQDGSTRAGHPGSRPAGVGMPR